jgi:uncharacterized protein YaaW (UPF0174 family)
MQGGNMAIGDELDKLLVDGRILQDDWNSIEKILGVTIPAYSPDFVNLQNTSESIPIAEIKSETNDRRIFVSKEIRHNYGHSVRNLFREWYEPDYAEIVRATADKLKINIKEHHTISEIEDRILAEVIDLAKENIIKEYGQSAWDNIVKQVEQDIDDMISKGGLSAAVIENLKKARGAGVIAVLIAGNLAGFSLYIILNQTFFAIARFIGLRIGVAVAGPIIGGTVAFLLGPAGWLFAGLLLVFDLGDTSWKKTIPSVVIVASYRRKLGLA